MSCLGYKSHHVLIGILTHQWHPKLIEVLLWVKVRYDTSKVTITSAYRSHKIHDKDSGIHITIPLRAFDIRSSVFDDPQAIADDINDAFIYDPDRPDMKVAIYHDSGSGLHFHIQVHDHTIYRKILTEVHNENTS